MSPEADSEVCTRPTVDLSVIVPVGERVGELSAILDEYSIYLSESGSSFEVIVVIDGPHGQIRQELVELGASRRWLQLIELARPFGEAAALAVGIAAARGKYLLTLPAYRQVIPSELLKLLEARGDVDMAVAVRWPRAGRPMARARRALFHGLVSFVTGSRFRDLTCGMRLFRREVAEEIPLYGDRHHLYPVLARSRGFRVREVEVNQGRGDNFRGSHTIRRSLHRVLDLLTLFFLVRFTKKPLRFFGTIGVLCGVLGAIFLAVLVVERLFFGVSLADRPALLLSALLVVLGVQVFAIGLIGELIIFTHARQMKDYVVRQVIAIDKSEVLEPGGDS